MRSDHDSALLAAVYLRVSSEEQARHGYSLDFQAEKCRERALELGATGIVFYRDPGVSGALLDRPGLNALRQAVRNKEIDLVVVLDPDRFARNVAHQLLVTEEIDRSGARLEFVNFEWRNTPEGQLFYAIRGAIAQYEKEKIRERTMAGRLQKARLGKMPHAHQPYGYDYDRSNSTLVPNPREAPVVRMIFSLFVKQQLGYSAIAARLNEQGIPTKKAAPSWHRAVVRQILMNPVYTGTFWANRYDCRNLGLNKFKKPADRLRPSLRDRQEWIPISVTPLVPNDLWEEAQARIKTGIQTWSKRRRRIYLLAGLLHCAACRSKLVGQQVYSGNRRYPYYLCSRSHEGRPRIRADDLEAAIWDWVKGRLDNPECFAYLLNQKPGDNGLGTADAAPAEEEKLIEERRAAACRAFAAGHISDREWREIVTRLDTRIKALQRRKMEWQARASWFDRQDPLRAREQARLILERGLKGLSLEQKRCLIAAVVVSVNVGPGSVDVLARVADEEVLTWRKRERDLDAPQSG
ncbi:MAG: recombinase family protein [Bacillota bacterium]